MPIIILMWNILHEKVFLGAVYMGAGTGRLAGRDVTRDVYVSIIFIAFLLHEAGTFFVPSRLGGISLSATEIPAPAGRFLSYKRFTPPEWGNVNFLFWQFLAVIWTIVLSHLYFISITYCWIIALNNLLTSFWWRKTNISQDFDAIPASFTSRITSRPASHINGNSTRDESAPI